jgi:hypothetical protein
MWRPIKEEEAGRSWNEQLARFDDCSPFQTFEWGQYHKALGWEPVYFACFDREEKITSMALGLLKRFPFKTGFLWCTGGPVGAIENWDEKLTEAVREELNLKRLYFRFRCDRPRRTRDALYLEHHEWCRPLFSMGSSFSMELDLTEDAETLFKGLSKSWKRNLRLGEKNEPVIRQISDPDAEELRAAFAEMEKLKELPELFSKDKLESLFRNARPNLILLRCEDREGNLLAFRGTLFIGRKACDYLAVTTARGRELRASFPVFWEMFRLCRERGITHYDLGGIDPWKNPGVYEFKRGTGAAEVEFLGEWDRASASWLRRFGNFAIRRRQGSKRIGTAKNKGEDSAGRFFGPARRLVRGIAGSFLNLR